MALTSGDFMKPAYTFWSGSFPILKAYEGGSLDVMQGCPVIQDTSNCLGIASSDSAIDVVGVTIARTANTTSGTVYMNYIPMMVGTVWEVSICGDAHATLTLASTHLFVGGELTRDSTYDVWGFDPSATTNNFYIIGFKDATGTVHGRVYITPSTSGRSVVWC